MRGHVSLCATMHDWATDRNAPVQLAYGLSSRCDSVCHNSMVPETMHHIERRACKSPERQRSVGLSWEGGIFAKMPYVL